MASEAFTKITPFRSLVITMSDDEEEDELPLQQPYTTSMEISEEEKLQLDLVIANAQQLVISTPEPVQYCVRLTNNVNKVEEKYSFATKKATADDMVLVPCYQTAVNFNKITWVQSSDKMLPKLKQQNYKPALWVMEDYNPLRACQEELEEGEEEQTIEELYEDHKISWLKSLKKDFGNWPFAEKGFIVWELSYLVDPVTNKRGLVGMTFLKCSHGRITRVDDICNIKISTNQRNTAQGDLYDFLIRKYSTLKIYIYVPEFSYMINIFKSDLFPWSGMMRLVWSRVRNLISIINVSIEDADKMNDKCFDAKTHSRSCSTCNALNLLYKVSHGKYVERHNRIMRNPLRTPLKRRLPLYETVVCKYVTFVTYGKVRREAGWKTTTYCRCHEMPAKRKAEEVPRSVKRVKN